MAGLKAPIQPGRADETFPVTSAQQCSILKDLFGDLLGVADGAAVTARKRLEHSGAHRDRADRTGWLSIATRNIRLSRV